MKKPLATRSTSSSAAIGNATGLSRKRCAAFGFALFVLVVTLCDRGAAQTSAALRERAIQQWVPARQIDRSKLARQGFRVLEGRHVTLVTDLESTPAVDELPTVVDAAVPLLAECTAHAAPDGTAATEGPAAVRAAWRRARSSVSSTSVSLHRTATVRGERASCWSR